MQIFYTKIVLSDREPSVTNVIWAKLFKGNKLAFYLFMNGKWTPFTVVNDKGTPSTDDDEPWEGGSVGPNTVGTDEIVDNSIQMDDLNDSVKDKIQKIYDTSDESLHMDFDVTD